MPVVVRVVASIRAGRVGAWRLTPRASTFLTRAAYHWPAARGRYASRVEVRERIKGTQKRVLHGSN